MEDSEPKASARNRRCLERGSGEFCHSGVEKRYLARPITLRSWVQFPPPQQVFCSCNLCRRSSAVSSRVFIRPRSQVRSLPSAPFVVLLLRVNHRMSCYVYIIKCQDSSLYTGITWDLKKREKEHNIGEVLFTKNRRPAKLIYWEKYKTRKEAAKREKEIKGWRREKKEKLISSLH